MIGVPPPPTQVTAGECGFAQTFPLEGPTVPTGAVDDSWCSDVRLSPLSTPVPSAGPCPHGGRALCPKNNAPWGECTVGFDSVVRLEVLRLMLWGWWWWWGVFRLSLVWVEAGAGAAVVWGPLLGAALGGHARTPRPDAGHTVDPSASVSTTEPWKHSTLRRRHCARHTDESQSGVLCRFK